MARRRKTVRRKTVRNASRKSPISIKKSNRGKLRATAGVKKGKKIPVSTLRRLKNSKNPKTRRRATFALNARKFKH